MLPLIKENRQKNGTNGKMPSLTKRVNDGDQIKNLVRSKSHEWNLDFII